MIALMRRISSVTVSSKTWSVYPESKTCSSPEGPWSSFISQPTEHVSDEMCYIITGGVPAYNSYRYPCVISVDSPEGHPRRGVTFSAQWIILSSRPRSRYSFKQCWRRREGSNL